MMFSADGRAAEQNRKLTPEPIEDSVSRYGVDHEFTKLCINHKGIDPDDAFSTVPYEKGFHFLYHLDRLVGRANFDKFIPHYFTTYAGKSLDSFAFKDTFLAFFNGLGDEVIKDKVAAIAWDEWFFKPGLPPKPDFDTSLAEACYALAEKWKNPVSITAVLPLLAPFEHHLVYYIHFHVHSHLKFTSISRITSWLSLYLHPSLLPS